MESNTVQIFLDNPQAFYFPGQTISGHIECFFNKQKNLKAVKVKFVGKAETKWTDTESYYDNTEKKNKTKQVLYVGQEIYFDVILTLLTGDDSFSLPVGRHSFPFSYVLPAQLPSSYEGEYGQVYYTITALIERPWKFAYEAVAHLKIISPLDLNYQPIVNEPLQSSTDKEVCCCWCKSGPITFNMSLPVAGYVPGETVYIGAYVQNMSNVSADSVTFALQQVVEFIAHHPGTKSKCSRSTICSTQDGGIGAHGEKSWTSELVIPKNFPFPNLLSCSIMHVAYTLHGEVVLPCPHANLQLKFPVTIGTVPISGVRFNFPGPPTTNAEISVSSEMHGASANVGLSGITPLIHDTPAAHSNAQISNIPPYSSEKHESPQPHHSEQTCASSGSISYIPSAPAVAPIGIHLQSSSADPPTYEEAILYEKNNKK